MNNREKERQTDMHVYKEAANRKHRYAKQSTKLVYVLNQAVIQLREDLQYRAITEK